MRRCARVRATMSKAARCARQCQKSVILALLQGILVAAFLLFAFYVASILLEPAPLLGITTGLVRHIAVERCQPSCA